MRQHSEERLDTIEGTIKAKVDPLDLTKFDTINASITELERTLDVVNAKIASDALNGGKPLAADPEYSDVFAKYFRTGDGENEVKAAQRTGPRAAMSEGVPADGGYTTPIEWDRSISGRLKLISPIRQNATVQPISKLGFTKLFTDRTVGSGWVGETAARPATSTPQFTALAFSLGEIYANAAASQDLLDDSEINIEQWLVGEIDTEFDRQEGIAFLSGDGTNKPFGLLTHVTGGANAARHPWGAILTTPSGAVGGIASDNLVTLQYALPAAYTPNAKFFMNRNSLGTIRKLKDGQGNYLWQPSFQAGVPATLGGYPVIDLPDMPAASTGNIALLFGDMAATYLVIDRMGTRVLRDPYTNKPYVCFYVTKRVGGGVVNPDAMKAMVIG
jgi:HK97 family phage major capsid protein